MRLCLLLLVVLPLVACGPDEPTVAQPVAASPTDDSFSTDTDSLTDHPIDPTDEPALTDAETPTDSEAGPTETPAEGFAGSCDLRASESMCYAFTGAGWTTQSGRTECATGAFQTQACPITDRIGVCIYQPGGDAAREVTYTFYAPMDPLIAEGVCRGTFRRL